MKDPIMQSYDEVGLLLCRLGNGASLAETLIAEHDNLELLRGELRFVVTAQKMLCEAAERQMDALWDAIQVQKRAISAQNGGRDLRPTPREQAQSNTSKAAPN